MIKIEEYKEPQHNLTSEEFLNPKKLYLPLSQHTGKPSLACVKNGDIVEEAEMIAKEDGFISCRLHSPKKGRIVNIDTWGHPDLKRWECIILECEHKEKEYTLRRNLDNLTKEELLEIIKNSGIVGMGGASFPTHVKLKPPQKIDTLIINGCECEPYLAADYRLMVENLKGIFLGIEIISKIVEPRQVIFALEDNKPEAIKKVNLFINTKNFKIPQIKILVLKTAYPQGGEKQLIYAATKRKVSGDKLPFDVGCLVHNVATCFAIYEAVYYDKPLIERLVSFCGDALDRPKNIWVKIGTSLQELFDKKILEFKYEPRMIISGGPMMGKALEGLDYPILKGSGGFLFLRNSVEKVLEGPCIRCGRCIDNCPMNLLPLEFVKYVKKEKYKKLIDFNINDCIECGCCAFSCPSKIPLVHYIKIGKYYASKNS